MTLLRTGVGSLPHRDAAAAAEFVVSSADVAYLPQLPNRHDQESMLVQWGDGMFNAGQQGTSLRLDTPIGNRAEAFGGATVTLQQLAAGPIKTQATGPVTLAAALRSAGVAREGLLDLVADALVERIQSHLAWVRRSGFDQVVLVLDEPALAALGTPHRGLPEPARRALRRVKTGIDAEVGLHCCGDSDWGAIADMGFDWLSWDLSALGPGFHSGLDQIAVALGRGARVMWGIIPTATGPLPETHVLVGRYGTAVANLVVAGAPMENLKERALFTPACGLAGLSVDDAEAVVELLGEVVEEVDDAW